LFNQIVNFKVEPLFLKFYQQKIKIMDGFDQNGLPITGAGVDYSTVGKFFSK
jgi:hypothetical protein